MKNRTLLILAACCAASASMAAPIVYDDFESKTLGPLGGQPSNGPSPWISTAFVVNSGPVLGTQAAMINGTAAGGLELYHSRVNLVPFGGYSIPAGWKLKASVDVYSDFALVDTVTGIGMWSNSHSVEHSLMTLKGGWGEVSARHGSGSLAPMLGYISNPPLNGWHNLALIVEQTSPTTLTTTYMLDGNVFMYNGFTVNTHTDTVLPQNQVFDFSLYTANTNSGPAFIESRYDNYKVELVPEPGAIVALALGVGLLLRRRH